MHGKLNLMLSLNTHAVLIRPPDQHPTATPLLVIPTLVELDSYWGIPLARDI